MRKLSQMSVVEPGILLSEGELFSKMYLVIKVLDKNISSLDVHKFVVILHQVQFFDVF